MASSSKLSACIIFYYNLKLGGVSSLSVISMDANLVQTVVWQLSSKHNTASWELGQVHVDNATRIIFQVEKSEGANAGFASIDEILVETKLDHCDTTPPEAEPSQTTAKPTTKPPSSDPNMIVGEYEWSNGPSNYWHYVHIDKTGDDTYQWTNAAGVQWSLTFQDQADSEGLVYAVGKECPYYTSGYTNATLHVDTPIIQIEGPYQELYVQLPYVSNIIIGQYELTSGPTNAWHYVDIALKSNDTHDIFTWTNVGGGIFNKHCILISISGVSWTLTYLDQYDPETLTFTVGDDCPYHGDGYTETKLFLNASKGIEIEGPGAELYVRLKKGTSK